ncbi:hypothetical protein DY000_02029621 [Brassica cretica]|uniref:Uncharacterized protein n=1 Tax=Brassica cretica TaxID=69181 RepID=A0ABQ7DPP2_BRACR|nr:hypothetical protein DY000_02029621 [Brassica cretica]
MSVRIDLKMKLVNLEKETRKFKKHIPMAFVERVKEDFHCGGKATTQTRGRKAWRKLFLDLRIDEAVDKLQELGGEARRFNHRRHVMESPLMCEKLDDRGGKMLCCGDASRSVVPH